MKLIKFYADWCQPCKMLSKVMEEIEFPYPVESVNIDNDTESALLYGIRSVPTLLLIDENGNITKRLNGFMKQKQLQESLGLGT